MEIIAHRNHRELEICLRWLNQMAKEYPLCLHTIEYQIRGGGFQFSLTNGRSHHYADLRYNDGTGNLVCEFNVSCPKDPLELPLIKVVKLHHAEEMARAIIRWFAISDGQLFHVDENGHIPAYRVVRFKGKTHISPRTEK